MQRAVTLAVAAAVLCAPGGTAWAQQAGTGANQLAANDAASATVAPKDPKAAKAAYARGRAAERRAIGARLTRILGRRRGICPGTRNMNCIAMSRGASLSSFMSTGPSGTLFPTGFPRRARN